MEGDRSRTQMAVVAQGEAMKMCCTGGCAGDKGDCCEDTGVCFGGLEYLCWGRE